eukprot:4293099-Prymnesium_polylepis.1
MLSRLHGGMGCELSPPRGGSRGAARRRACLDALALGGGERPAELDAVARRLAEGAPASSNGGAANI